MLCHPRYNILLLLTAIGLMPGGSVYKDHAFNKETAHTSDENSTIHRTDFHSTVQVHQHYETRQRTENTEENKLQIQKKTRLVQCPEMNPGRQAYSSSLHSLSNPDPVNIKHYMNMSG
jgi:hypothetical protein